MVLPPRLPVQPRGVVSPPRLESPLGVVSLSCEVKSEEDQAIKTEPDWKWASDTESEIDDRDFDDAILPCDPPLKFAALANIEKKEAQETKEVEIQLDVLSVQSDFDYIALMKFFDVP